MPRTDRSEWRRDRYSARCRFALARICAGKLLVASTKRPAANFQIWIGKELSGKLVKAYANRSSPLTNSSRPSEPSSRTRGDVSPQRWEARTYVLADGSDRKTTV